LPLGIIRVCFSFNLNQRKENTSMIKRFTPNSTVMRQWRSGPLSGYLDSFAELLVQQGYSSNAGWKKVRLVVDLSRWLAQQRLKIGELDEQQSAMFLDARWKRHPRQSGDQSTLMLLLRHLRQQEIIADPATPCGAIDFIQRDYGHFLIHERGFVPGSVAQYVHVARRFLLDRFPDEQIRLPKLSAKDVTDFVTRDTAVRGRRSAQLMTAVMRSFLGYLFQAGRSRTNLAMAVPTVAGWRLSELPRYLEVAQVEKLLRSCDRRRKVGKRNYAVLLLLARLGLRAGEVSTLTLNDIDWDAGELRIRGKGDRVDRLPLPKDVGQAIADYLQKGRPRCSSRRVFIQSKAPYVGFASQPNAICGIVRSTLARAHIQTRNRGAHLLRHSLATRMLGNGGSLAEIGRVLRHQQIQTTEIYAKVDLNALRAMTHPWLGGAL